MKTLLISSLSTLLFISPALAADLGGNTFLRISGPDARAVVKTPEGENKLVKVGDVVGTAKVVEINADRVIMEQEEELGTAVLIVKVKDGRQQVNRVQKIPVRGQAISGGAEEISKPFGQ